MLIKCVSTACCKKYHVELFVYCWPLLFFFLNWWSTMIMWHLSKWLWRNFVLTEEVLWWMGISCKNILSDLELCIWQRNFGVSLDQSMPWWRGKNNLKCSFFFLFKMIFLSLKAILIKQGQIYSKNNHANCSVYLP